MTDRYSRQIIFPEIGEAGQRQLGSSSVAIIGCGALGTVLATIMVRAGIGKIKIVDRDFIEYHNLQRQIIFDEEDIKAELPKAIAAERHLKQVNSAIEIEGVVADVNYTNIERLVSGADLILDGLDNLETRFIINDAALKLKIPWVYGGAISASGMTMNIMPGESPCFRCICPDLLPPGMVETCDTAGVISPAPMIIGALQSVEALKILTGSKEISRDLIVIDVWKGNFNRFKVRQRPECPACQGKYDFLAGQVGIKTIPLCGQNAVQILNLGEGKLSLTDLAKRLNPLGEVTYNEYMLRFKVSGREMVIFPDGRAIIRGTTDESMARGLYARYIGI